VLISQNAAFFTTNIGESADSQEQKIHVRVK
jgi:hypothetical protein